MSKTKKNTFRYKFLSILIVFVLCFLKLFTVDVKASSNYTHKCSTSGCDFSCDIYYPDNVPIFDVDLGSGAYHSLHYFFIVKDNDVYKLISYNMRGTAYEDGYFYMSGNTVIFNHHRATDYWHYNNETKEWINDGWSWGSYTLPESAKFVVSSTDIYKDVDKKEIFFQKPLPLAITITEIAKAEELPTMIVKTLQMIIPIGLVVLSIGLLIYVVKSVILRVT